MATRESAQRAAGSRVWAQVFRLMFRFAPEARMRKMRLERPDVPIEELTVASRRTGKSGASSSRCFGWMARGEQRRGRCLASFGSCIGPRAAKRAQVGHDLRGLEPSLVMRLTGHLPFGIESCHRGRCLARVWCSSTTYVTLRQREGLQPAWPTAASPNPGRAWLEDGRDAEVHGRPRRDGRYHR
jgi:hypothetical protein